MLAIISGCAGTDDAPEEKLVGKWNRADGNYTLDISVVEADGKLSVAYLNPSPIHVGRSGWRIKEDVLQIYVELRDENYPGSIYQLSYNVESDILAGTYYQAVARQTYEVNFNREQ